jgi:hypothetical protein
MHLRSEDDGQSRSRKSSAPPILPARHETKSERVREIRLRVAADAYRSAGVAEEIARRILTSREL